ncbi:MAG TPA: hypothetical protein VG225_02415 [Terracidiphilus sp.]|jgi:hypothetical protein|nr:hypothetical protein [Terracidiphilus sp.]
MLGGAVLPASLAESSASSRGETFRPENLVAFNGISQHMFERLVGERFAVSSGGHSLGAMTLISVSELAPHKSAAKNLRMVGRVPHPSSPRFAGFAVRFQGTAPALSQGTYTLQNPSVGELPLLLVPSGPGATPDTYTAVFGFLAA